ncbi:hypothetical protein [Salinisphaera sp. PC39]|uniref:hypothetical protein n=1 Tax=Salinisphaera sp. PC39 TaxID=1304156 RepID=UPI00333F9ED6
MPDRVRKPRRSNPPGCLSARARVAVALLLSVAVGPALAQPESDMGVTMSVIEDEEPSSEADVVNELRLPERAPARPDAAGPGKEAGGPPPDVPGREAAEQARENGRQLGREGAGRPENAGPPEAGGPPSGTPGGS